VLTVKPFDISFPLRALFVDGSAVTVLIFNQSDFWPRRYANRFLGGQPLSARRSASAKSRSPFWPSGLISLGRSGLR